MIEFAALAGLFIAGSLVLGALEFYVRKTSFRDAFIVAVLSMIPTMVAAVLLVIFL
jgi:hypothetical protein